MSDMWDEDDNIEESDDFIVDKDEDNFIIEELTNRLGGFDYE